VSIQNRHYINLLHPWLQERVRFILDFADYFEGNYHVTSSLRTAGQQDALLRKGNRFAVPVGCSQHQYGLAVDIEWPDPGWQSWWLGAARAMGLTTVAGDTVHAQAIPGATFRQWAESQGLCPDPAYLPTRVDASVGIFGEYCSNYSLDQFGYRCNERDPYPDE